MLFYTMFTCQYNFDFTSFYSAVLASIKGRNPYDAWIADYLPFIKRAPVNLNPPIFLLLFYPLGYLSYQAAIAIWLTLSFVFGLMGAWVAFYYAFSRAFLTKYWLILFMAYLALFGTLMNYSIAQMGTVLVLLIMLGYHFYLQNNDNLAGFCWGLIISLKLFPALLFIYVLKQRRFKVCAMMGATIALCFLLPLLVYGVTIYSQFYKTMSSIWWYHNSWNASVLGFIYRGITELNQVEWIMPVYALIFCLTIILYVVNLGSKNVGAAVNHQPFCLTLVVMLILSPLGWLYYFPMLIFPLCLLWAKLMQEPEALSSKAQVFLVALFLINFPVNNHSMNSDIVHVKLSSFYFFGLLLFAYLLVITKDLSGNNDIVPDERKQSFLFIIFIIIAFGLIIPGTGFLLRLATACVY
ncbi:MAG: glycosyltransferase family 87 protein [Legionella sp.]|nr:glycosyltransferase family 87 protein [Legionella sp.]